MMERYASLNRKTKETEVSVELFLDGGPVEASTGVGFFDHMLTAFGVHGGFGLKVKTVGDWHVDCHHTIEDTGIVLGAAFPRPLEKSRELTALAAPLSPWMKLWGSRRQILAGGRFLCSRQSFPKSGPAILTPA